MAIDLDGVRFVVAPGQFPPRLPFVLVRDDRLIPETLPLLQAFAPTAPFRGYVSPAVQPQDIDPSAALVISSPDWAFLVTSLRQRFPPNRLVVLLSPSDYPWGYLTVARSAPDHLAELADPGVPAGMKARWLEQYLVRHAYATFEADQPKWYPDCYFTPYRGLVRENAAAVHDVFAGLSDQESRDAYSLVLYGSPEEMLQRFLGRVFREQQYVEMTRLRPGDTVVNVGVADGWDIPYLLAQTRGHGRHLLIDPTDPPPGSTAATLREPFGLEFMPGGLWDRQEVLRFPVDETGMIVGAKPGGTDPAGRILSVRCLPLDDLILERDIDRIDLVKMDIEGAEPRALKGMRQAIRSLRPQVAVCVYHQPDHMWTIPAMLMSWLTDYRFYLRHYSPVRFECVFYAIPAERLPAEGSGDPVLDATGVDGRQLRRAWEAAGVKGEFPARVSGDSLPEVVATIGRGMATSPAGAPVAEGEWLAAGEEFVGAGWGPAGWKKNYSWRWIGPDGTGSLFVPLDRTVDISYRLYLFTAESQEPLDRAALDVDGTAAVDREFGKDGDYYYIQWRIPAAPTGPRPARSRLTFRTLPGPKRVAVYKVTWWRAA